LGKSRTSIVEQVEGRYHHDNQKNDLSDDCQDTLITPEWGASMLGW